MVIIRRLGLMCAQNCDLAQVNLGQKTHFYGTARRPQRDQTPPQPRQSQRHGINCGNTRRFNDQIDTIAHAMLAHHFGDIPYSIGINTNICAPVSRLTQPKIIQINRNNRKRASQPRKGRRQLAHNTHTGNCNNFTQFWTPNPMPVHGNRTHNHKSCGPGQNIFRHSEKIPAQNGMTGVIALRSNAITGFYPLHIFAHLEHHTRIAISRWPRKCPRTRRFTPVCIIVNFRTHTHGSIIILHQNAIVWHTR